MQLMLTDCAKYFDLWIILARHFSFLVEVFFFASFKWFHSTPNMYSLLSFIFCSWTRPMLSNANDSYCHQPLCIDEELEILDLCKCDGLVFYCSD